MLGCQLPIIERQMKADAVVGGRLDFAVWENRSEQNAGDGCQHPREEKKRMARMKSS
jgi:hypothetical protein